MQCNFIKHKVLIKFFSCNEMDVSGIDNKEILDLSIMKTYLLVECYQVVFYDDHILESILLVYMHFIHL